MKKDDLQKVISLIENMKKNIHGTEYRFLERTLRDFESYLNKYEWKEKYNLPISEDSHPDNTVYKLLIKHGSGYIINWDEERKIYNSDPQPELDRWVVHVSFPTGPYIFGENYDYELFDEYFKFICKEYNPDFVDYINHGLYWYRENVNSATYVLDEDKLFNKFVKLHSKRAKEKEIKELEDKLKALKGGK